MFSGALVVFIGQAVEVKSVAWTSDRDGKLADRLSFETGQLSQGPHRITLEVVDGRGTQLTTGIAIDVT